MEPIGLNESENEANFSKEISAERKREREKMRNNLYIFLNFTLNFIFHFFHDRKLENKFFFVVLVFTYCNIDSIISRQLKNKILVQCISFHFVSIT